ncbi:hypothetical protein KAR91_78830 [Candidatus Pacearchaeota archaeon]|nr:hypothetical protein [Candidatus Pacearchaeota archaeon]
MALQESFELSDGTGWATYGTIWSFQTWTTTSAYTITDVALYGFKYDSCGDVKVSIREVDVGTGKPTGGDKCSVTVAEGVISDFPTRAWYTFTFDDSYALDDAKQYAIVIRATGGSAANYYAPFGYGSSGYAGGGSGTGNGTAWGAVSTTDDMDFRTYGGTPLPGKPTNPSPTDAVSDITLDETPLSWDASDPVADTYEVYFRESGGSWELVGVAQAGLEWTIDFGTLNYGTTYEWRIDATNVYGTTTGDTWSFDSLVFSFLRISYVLIPGGSGAGPYDDPPGTEGTDWAWTGENTTLTVKRLVVAIDNKIWVEDL